LGVTILLLSAFLACISPTLARLIAPGFSPNTLHLTATFMRVMFLSDFFLTLSVVFGAVLQSTHRFFLYALAPVLYNLGIIAGVIFFVPAFGLIGLPLGVVFGSGLHVLVQLYGARRMGYRYAFIFQPNDPETKKMGKLLIPRTMGVAAHQINMVAMTIIATTLASGSVAILQFAYNIQFFPLGILAISFAVAAFPTLAQFVAKGDLVRFRETVSQTARQMLFFIIPAAMLFLLLRAQIVRVVVGAGIFGWNETLMTADTLAFFVLSLFAQALIFLLARAFFAREDTVTPFFVGLFSMIVNVIAAIFFTRFLGVAGLGASFSLSSILEAATLWIILRLKVGALYETELIRSLLLTSLAVLPMGLVIQMLKSFLVHFVTLKTFWSVLLQGLFAGTGGLAVFFLVAYLLKSPELISFLQMLRGRWNRRLHPSEVVFDK
jgi:putative peptidoglycan lipid II flippase